MLCQFYSGTVFLYICVYITVLFIKEEEGDRFGRDKKGKEKGKKNKPEKTEETGFSVDRRKAASEVFPAGAPYLI